MNTVTVPYDPTWPALTWAKEHCPSYVTNSASPSGVGVYNIVYYFGDEKDALMFMLRWS